MLLKSATLLIYTPSNEHFGIVPLEAMLAGVPVLAANTGGPLETVVDGTTGWHCPPDDIWAWTAVMNKVLHKLSDQELRNMGNAGKERVKAEFSDVKMAERLDRIISKMAYHPRKSYRVEAVVIAWATFLFDAALQYATSVYDTYHDGAGSRFRRYVLPPYTITVLSVIYWIFHFSTRTEAKTPRKEVQNRKKTA